MKTKQRGPLTPKRKIVSLKVLHNRSCGECSVCCDVMGVESLGKPFFARCKHLDDNGCGIYDTKPQECSGYKCLWLQGAFAEDDRPDKSGVLVSPESTGLYAYILRAPTDLQVTIDAIMAKIKAAGIWLYGVTQRKTIIMLFGQKIQIPFEAPEYDFTDTKDGPYQMQETKDYYFGAGPWRQLLMPLETSDEPK